MPGEEPLERTHTPEEQWQTPTVSSDEIVRAMQERADRGRLTGISTGSAKQTPDCLNQNAHNFDIGPTHAVCKICCKVVPLISYPKEPEGWWHQPGHRGHPFRYSGVRDGSDEDMGI